MGGAVLSRLAPAKLNLFLHITGRRADGYHQIQSLFVFADFGDQIFFRKSDRLELVLDGPFAGKLDHAPDNLVWRAAGLIAGRAGRTSPGAELRLVKNLPVAGGIGGGSADAAATLSGLNQLWQLGIPEAELSKMALELGADVPACLTGRASLVGGIGESVTPLEDFPKLAITMINPGVPLSTARVFAALRASGTDFSQTGLVPDMSGLGGQINMADWLRRESRNDLQPAAWEIVPEIGDVLGFLEETPGCLMARMSGSGPTCFGLFDTDDNAGTAARLANLNRDWWAQAVVAS